MCIVDAVVKALRMIVVDGRPVLIGGGVALETIIKTKATQATTFRTRNIHLRLRSVDATTTSRSRIKELFLL